MTGWRMWSWRNCARNLNLTILISGICTIWNQEHKLIRDSKIQTDHLTSARSLDLGIVDNKREPAKYWTLQSLAEHRVELKEEKKKNDEYLDLAWKPRIISGRTENITRGKKENIHISIFLRRQKQSGKM